MRTADMPLIRRSRLLGHVPEPELLGMLTTCFVQSLPKGTALCRQAERPEFLHIVLDGTIGLFGEGPRGEQLIEFFGPGDSFILPAVMLDVPYLMTAKLLTQARILLWPAASFRAEVRKSGPLAYGAALLLSSYWRSLIGQIKDLKLLSATERLSAFLLALAPRQDGPVTIPLPGGHRLIAGRLGITPQSLSRALAVLRPLGVSSGRREIRVDAPARLREFAAVQQLGAPRRMAETRRRADHSGSARAKATRYQSET